MLPNGHLGRVLSGDNRPNLDIKWHHGEMAERTKAPVSKTGMGATSSWVRIPLSPPLSGTKKSCRFIVCRTLFLAIGQKCPNFLTSPVSADLPPRPPHAVACWAGHASTV